MWFLVLGAEIGFLDIAFDGFGVGFGEHNIESSPLYL